MRLWNAGLHYANGQAGRYEHVGIELVDAVVGPLADHRFMEVADVEVAAELRGELQRLQQHSDEQLDKQSTAQSPSDIA